MKKYSALDFGASPLDGKSHTDHYDAQDLFLDGATAPANEKRRPSIRDSVGLARLCILTLGVAAIVAATALLAVLWSGASIAVNQGDPGYIWKSVVSRGWAPITVTLCAAAIRTAASLQAGVAMSMVASVVLEQHHVSLGDSAFLSIIRAVSVQPINLLFSGGRGIVRSLGPLGLFLIVTMSLTALASTFASSILLSDFGDIAILAPFTTSLITYGNDSASTAMDVWRSPPVQYPRFAEYTNGSRLVGEHIDDTGFAIRVPLPMADSVQRQTLREYTGPAVVFDDRVVCVAPRNLTFLSFNSTLGSRGTTSTALFAFRGIATFDSSQDLPPPLQGEMTGKQVPFYCHVPRTYLAIGLPSNITVCTVRVPTAVGDQLSPLLLGPAFTRPMRSRSYIPPIFFVFKLTTSMGKRINWDDFGTKTYFKRPQALNQNETRGYEIPQDALAVSKEGPWHQTRMESIEGLEGITFSVSTCVANNIGVAYSNVTMTSQSDGPEPALAWQGGVRGAQSDIADVWALRYDTAAVRRQLNATAGSSTLTRQQRGVMDLDFGATNWTAPLNVLNGGAEFNLVPEELFPELQTVRCGSNPSACSVDPSAMMASALDNDVGHPTHVALFSDTLAETGSPARALQSWLNVMTRQKFYDSLGRFVFAGEAQYAQSVRVFAPQRWGGFFGVVAVLGCHLLAMACVTVWFLRATRHTMLGNSWQAVSQVVSDATLPLLQRAGYMKDSEVTGIIRKQMGEAGRYGIARLRKPDRESRRELVAISP